MRAAAVLVVVLLAPAGASYHGLVGCVPVGAATPPSQPAAGPGGREYAHAEVRSSLLPTPGASAWVFEPAEPAPANASVVVLLHGFNSQAPSLYRGWLTHLTLRGHVVVFPQWHVAAAGPSQAPAVAAAAVRAALDFLDSGDHVRPDRNRFALTGHSAGGFLAADLAALHEAEGLPRPRAVMPVAPGGGQDDFIPLVDLSSIPSDALLLAIATEEDEIVWQEPARRIYREADAVPPGNKDYVLVRSDRLGCPALAADHSAVLGGAAPPHEDPIVSELFNRNALDWMGWWRLLDALAACAFEGQLCETALGNTTAQRFMGQWSTGAPVRELVVEDPL